MVASLVSAARFVGVGVGVGALILETLALRAPGTLPIVRLIQRELRRTPKTRQVLLGLAAGLLLVGAPVAWSIALGGAEMTFDPKWSFRSIIAVIATVVVKLLWVFFEEVVFRAALITALRRWVGIPSAVAIAALVFAAAHGRDGLSAAVLAADGVGFGVAYVVTGSIQTPIAWHLSKNLAVWAVTGESAMQFATLPWRLTGSGSSALVDLCFAVLVVGLTSVALLRSSHRHIARESTPGQPVGPKRSVFT
jgi:membrane protease YdiL (CAAX protease family)